MENVNRFNFYNDNVMNAESDVCMTVKHTLDQGLDGGGVLGFRLSADPERYTDLNTILLAVEVQLKRVDGEKVDSTKDIVFLDRNGMHSLFTSVEVKFNDKVVSSMSNYPSTSCLSRLLGCSEDQRVAVWDELDGSWKNGYETSNLTAVTGSLVESLQAKKLANKITFIGRVYSDILMSSRQYLPPGISLSIDLRRALDHFSLCAHKDDVAYRLHMSSASLYVKRFRLRPSLVPFVQKSLTIPNPSLVFNKLDCQMMTVSKGSSVFRWLDCLHGGPLPNRMYVAFVSQDSIFGKLSRISTFFEPLNVASINFKLNGRDLLVEPIKMKIELDEDGKVNTLTSNFRMGYLSLVEILNQVSDQTSSLRLGLNDYKQGCILYAIELGKCGELGASTNGNVDVEVLFNDNKSNMEACILLFTESTQVESLKV